MVFEKQTECLLLPLNAPTPKPTRKNSEESVFEELSHHLSLFLTQIIYIFRMSLYLFCLSR
jgi:hypothetical protein